MEIQLLVINAFKNMLYNLDNNDYKCSAHDLWSNEERDFTPWLKEHIDEINQLTQLHLDPLGVEVKVGRYEIDILAEDGLTSSKVVIENQFGCSDHKHLGQCLTYMSNIGAKCFIWISESFTDEHLCAIKTLNDTTPEDYYFFAISFRCYKIDGKGYYQFDVKVRPNEMEKAKIAGTSLKAQRYFDVWERLADILNKEAGVQINPSYRSYTDISLPDPKGTYLGISQANARLRVYIWTYYDESVIRVNDILSSLDIRFEFTHGEKNENLKLWTVENENPEDIDWLKDTSIKIMSVFQKAKLQQSQ